MGTNPSFGKSAVLELLRLMRDNLDWPDVVAYIDKLPDRLQRHPLVVEQVQLVLASRKIL
jgi:hypothetical protein